MQEDSEESDISERDHVSDSRRLSTQDCVEIEDIRGEELVALVR